MAYNSSSSSRGSGNFNQRGGRGGSSSSFRGGSSGGRGGRNQSFSNNRDDNVVPDQILPMGSMMHSCEGEMVCKSMNEKIPYFNAPIYLENKTQVGKVDEILGPINEVYFTVKMMEGIVASSFKQGEKFFISPDKLLPLDRFLPKPKAPKAPKSKKPAGKFPGSGGPSRGGFGNRGGSSRGRGFGSGGATSRGGFGSRGGAAPGRGGRIQKDYNQFNKNTPRKF